LRDAGVDSMPGTAAEVLDDWRAGGPEKLTQRLGWYTAHQPGYPS